MSQSVPMPKKFLAELIGTFWLVLGGCGSAVLAAVFPYDNAAANPWASVFSAYRSPSASPC